jgi:hypothetical protein
MIRRLAEIQTQTLGGGWVDLAQLPLGATGEFNGPSQDLA